MEKIMSCFSRISVFPHPWVGLGLFRFRGFLQALGLHTLCMLWDSFCINICYCECKSEIKLRKNCACKKKMPFSAQKGESNGSVGLGREEQIPALKSHFISERSNPFTLQESGVGKSQNWSPGACTGHWAGSDTHHTTAQHCHSAQ